MFIGGRSVLGFDAAIASAAGPAYIVELAHPSYRGSQAGMCKSQISQQQVETDGTPDNNFWWVGKDRRASDASVRRGNDGSFFAGGNIDGESPRSLIALMRTPLPSVFAPSSLAISLPAGRRTAAIFT